MERALLVLQETSSKLYYIPTGGIIEARILVEISTPSQILTKICSFISISWIVLKKRRNVVWFFLKFLLCFCVCVCVLIKDNPAPRPDKYNQ